MNPTDIPAPTPAPDRPAAGARPWWRGAVIYQAYIRSFADGNGDGIGDIAGLRSRLGYLVDLGIDAVWINPWYPSPMADAGYDVSDYRAIEPIFGTLDDAEALIGEAHGLGLRILLDIVPNHTSDHHKWFVEALASAPGSPARRRYIFREGRGSGGKAPPNDWPSQFGGPAWTQVTTPDGGPGPWYLHLFAPGQPDLDWTNPEVRAEFLDILRFWFDRGVDGFRIDVAHGLAKDMTLRDVGAQVWPPTGPETVVHPFWDRNDVHEIYREWRRLADSYAEPRVFVGEAWVTSPVRLAHYVRADELNTTFNFDFLLTPWVAASLEASIRATLASHLAVGAPPTWVLSNHDVAREVSRYARPQGERLLRHLDDLIGLPADFDLGRRRARAAALLMLALPGSAYIYQGEELGLAEVENLPDDVLQGPHLLPVRRDQPGAGRGPRADTVGRPPAPVRVQPARRHGAALAAPAAGVGRVERRGRTRRRRLHARALPGRAAPPPAGAGPRGRRSRLARRPGRGPLVRPGSRVRLRRERRCGRRTPARGGTGAARQRTPGPRRLAPGGHDRVAAAVPVTRRKACGRPVEPGRKAPAGTAAEKHRPVPPPPPTMTP